jgi:L-fuculose-phosphate aldolase
MNEQELREQICQVGRLMHQFRLVDGNAGNISARLDDERLLITPSGLSKGFMRPDQLIIIDLEGNKLGPMDAPQLKPSSETPMHVEAFRQRSDIGGVVHAHPAHAIALTMAGINLQRYTIPEAIILLGTVPNAPYATPSTTEDRDTIADLVGGHDAIMLSYHGSLTLGRDPWEAYMRLETLEHTARLTFMVHQLGGGQYLGQEQMQKLLDVRQQLGYGS